MKATLIVIGVVILAAGVLTALLVVKVWKDLNRDLKPEKWTADEGNEYEY